MIEKRDHLNIVVLSCGNLGVQVARSLKALANVANVTLITAAYRRKPLTLMGKVRHIYRSQGPIGLLRVLAERMSGSSATRRPEALELPHSHEGIRHLHFQDFHDADCVVAIRDLQIDLGVLAGTYILKKEVFEVPRLGSINLHTGKAPDYRGSAPGFWELYNGDTAVGITIHRVSPILDEGAILQQELFPLDQCPLGDPLAYLDRYRREVLMPNGVRMLCEVVANLPNGLVGQPQDPTKARTYRTPTYKDIQELRRRVAMRRRREQSV